MAPILKSKNKKIGELVWWDNVITDGEIAYIDTRMGVKLLKDCRIITQYTGIKDKNGIKIYDGDVIKGIFNGEVVVATVEFKDGAFVGIGEYGGIEADGEYPTATTILTTEFDNYNLSSFKDIEKIHDITVHLCSQCMKNMVDSDNGFDTCQECLQKI